MKTAVYSWRVAPATKSALEQEARERGETMAELLDRITREWLERERTSGSDAKKREAEMRARALRACGTIAGGDPGRSTRARQDLRRRLNARRVG